MSIEKTPDAPLLFQFRRRVSSLTVNGQGGNRLKSAIGYGK